jgi:hypothetical protein
MINFVKNLFKKLNTIVEPPHKPVVVKTPKEIATENKQPYISVINTHVNTENVRNGFFELDWNEYFIVQLKSNGYEGDVEESIVDQWFQDLCRNIGSEEDIDMSRRGTGYVNRALRDDGRTEIY